MKLLAGLLDGWKLAGSQDLTRYTWDTIDHRDDVQGGSFNQYYGGSTRQYQARYDRIYCSKTAVADIRVPSFDLIANLPLTSNNHFLSDHFGISAVVNIQWKEQKAK